MIKSAIIAIFMLLMVCSTATADSTETFVLDTEWSFSAGVGKNFHVSSNGANVSEDIKYLTLLISRARIFHTFSGGSRFAYSVEGFFSYVRQESEDRYMIGLTPLLVYNFNAYGKLIPWIEAGVGFAVTNLDPEGFGGEYGFTPQAGFGFRYAISNRQYVRIFYRYHHISNAGLKERNKGIDTNFIFVGYSYSF